MGEGMTITLLEGENVIEVDSTARGVGVGPGASEEDVKPLAGVYEKQGLLRTRTALRCAVLLEASRVFRIRERPPSTSSASPRKASPNPSPSPTKSVRASPGKAARASPSPLNTLRSSGGRYTWVNPGAKQHVLVGDTLDFGTGGAGSFRCRFSFTLCLASTVAAEAAGGGSSSSSGGGGGGGGTKRRLEGTFADHSGDVRLSPTPPPAAIEIDDSSEDEGDGSTHPAAGAAAAATVSPASAPAPAPAPAVPKRRRKDRDGRSAGGTPPKSVEVVDLCGWKAFPNYPGGAGTSNALPLDLCISDGESSTHGSAVALGARATPIPPRGSSGGGCSSRGGDSSSSASSKERVEPERRVPPPARIDDDVSEPGVSYQEPRRAATAAAVDADFPLVKAAPPTTIENEQPEPRPPSPPSSPFRSLSLKPSSPPRPPSPSPPVQEEKRPISISASSSPAQRSQVPPPCHAPGCGGGGCGGGGCGGGGCGGGGCGGGGGIGGGSGTAGPMADLSTSPTRPRPRMRDDFRNFLKVSMRLFHEFTAPVVDEFLARGVAPHSTLCRVVMAELLKSRCSVRNELLRRQLRAMLDVDPDCWEPPVDDAPTWLEEVMRGMITGKTSASSAVPPKHAGEEARAGAEARAEAEARAAKEAPAAVEARTIVLEVVVDYLAGDRRKHCGTPLRMPPPVQGGPSPTSTSAMSVSAARVMQFFPQKERAPPRRNLKESTRAKKNAELARRDAQRAVETSAGWAVAMWDSTLAAWDDAGAGAGAGTGAAQNWRRRRRRRPQDSPAVARARLVTTRFLAEVVEVCGLPVRDACVAIRNQMDSFAGVPGVAPVVASTESAEHRQRAATDAAGGAAAPGARDTGCLGLGAAGRGGLVRAVLGRSFCPELARVLRDDLDGAGDCSPGAHVGEVGRLRALLSRVLRKAEGGSGTGLLLFVGS
eukprot:g14188.t1